MGRAVKRRRSETYNRKQQSVNPKLIPDYIAIEEKGSKNIIVDMKIVETEWDEDGGKNERPFRTL